MSAEAMAYVIRYSPYKGVPFTIHLLVGDVVNDMHNNRFWMSPSELGAKARTTRETASKWLWQAVTDGLLEVIVDNRQAHTPGTGFTPPSEFRFLMPALPAAYEPAYSKTPEPREDKSRGPRARRGHATPRDDRSRGPRVTTDHAAPRDEASRGRVTTDHAADRESPGHGESRVMTDHVELKEITQGTELKERGAAEMPSATAPSPLSATPPAADDAHSQRVIDAFVRSVVDTPPPAPSEAVLLAELIRDRNNARNALYGINRSAAATPNSVKECDLLLRVGPTPNDGFKQERVSFDDAVRLVNFVFDHGEPEARGFSWAGQFQAGKGVRKNWHGAAEWMAARSNGHGNGRVATLVPEDLADLSDLQLIELLKKGAELERVTAEMAARLDDPVGQAETLARFRDLLGGADGWPRGTSGPINKARFKMTDWIRAKQATGDQPALTRGA